MLAGLLIYKIKEKMNKSNIVVGGSIKHLSETKVKKGKMVMGEISLCWFSNLL